MKFKLRKKLIIPIIVASTINSQEGKTYILILKHNFLTEKPRIND